MLIDPYRRKIDYLRISLTDRCNLRCIYCMPKEGVKRYGKKEILTFKEIVRLVKIFTSLGVRRIRLTGGEPLVKRGIVDLVSALKEIEGIEDVCLTTNGLLLYDYANDLKKAGIEKINISLDTLNSRKFRLITGSDYFWRVIEGIDEARDAGFNCIKVNMVVMRGINNDEVIEFVNFAEDKGLILRFIEFMQISPFSDRKFFLPTEETKEILSAKYRLIKARYRSFGPAEYYKIDGTIIGFINTNSKNCMACSRLRLSSAGELKLCLYQPQGISLRHYLREDFDDEHISDIIAKNLAVKRSINYIQWQNNPDMHMSAIGG